MADLVVTEGYNGGIIQAQVGDTMSVQLPETPTTGFRWTVSAADSRILALIGDDFQPTSAGIGGGGLRIFRFLTKTEGNADLELRLTRSWAAGAPRDVFHTRVKVGSS